MPDNVTYSYLILRGTHDTGTTNMLKRSFWSVTYIGFFDEFGSYGTLLLPLYKGKGDKYECSNSRGISL